MKPKPATSYGFLDNENNTSNNNISLSPDDLNSLFIYSFRYCLGRTTYATQDFHDLVKKYLRFISKMEIKIIAKEIREYKEREGKIGHDCDDELWMKILEMIE